MKKLFLTLITALILLPTFAQKSDLSILYVGINPEKHPEEIKSRFWSNKLVNAEKRLRWADFEHFLKKHFSEVGMVHNEEYKESMSDNYDVTIFDALPKPIKKAERGQKPDGTYFYNYAEYLTKDFSAACVTIALNSSQIGEGYKNKFDYC